MRELQLEFRYNQVQIEYTLKMHNTSLEDLKVHPEKIPPHVLPQFIELLLRQAEVINKMKALSVPKEPLTNLVNLKEYKEKRDVQARRQSDN